MTYLTVKVYGPPGTGKTSRLMHYLSEEAKSGTPTDCMAYVAFGHDAVQHAKRRALETLHRAGVFVDDLPLMKTFHSLAWRLLGLGAPQSVTIQDEHRARFASWYGLGYDPHYDATIENGSEDQQDALLPFANYVYGVETWLTNNLRPLKDWSDAPLRFEGPTDDVEAYLDRWRAWKQKIGRIEFADVLERCRVAQPYWPATVLMVDEFQDVSPLQHALFRQWAAASERVYIAGDDDQTVFGFQGATPYFLIRVVADETEHLSITHRLPNEIREYAGRIIEKVHMREPKHVKTCDCKSCILRRGPDGARLVVLERPSPEALLQHIDPVDTLVLSRTRAQSKTLRGLLIKNGVPFHTLRGPEAPGALWSREVIAAKQFHSLLTSPTASVPYPVAAAVLGLMEPFIEATRTGYVERVRLAEFKALPKKVGVTWPLSGIGEDLSMWNLAMLRTYMRRVPGPSDLATALNLTAQQRNVLDLHFRLAPSWPISTESGIRIGTMHGSKGLEARTVVMLADTSKRALGRVYAKQEDHDAEHRLYYVGATRALRKLVILQPFAASSHFPLAHPEVSA